MIEFLKREKRLIAISILFGAVVSVIAGTLASRSFAIRVQDELAENVIRLHVVANSDSKNDQELKLKVRDEVIVYLEGELEGCRSKEESLRVIGGRLDEIESVAEEAAFKEGFHYDIDATLSREVFPLREYGDVRMPTGDYDALKISIGDAEGHNWWCVVYPPLCFVDIAEGEIKDENGKMIAVGEDADVLIKSGEIVPEFKFKIVEMWQEWMHRNDEPAVKP